MYHIFLLSLFTYINSVGRERWSLIFGSNNTVSVDMNVEASIDQFNPSVTPGSRFEPKILPTEQGFIVTGGRGFDVYESENSNGNYAIGQYTFEYSFDQNLWRWKSYVDRGSASSFLGSYDGSTIAFPKFSNAYWIYNDTQGSGSVKKYFFGGFGFNMDLTSNGYINDVYTLDSVTCQWQIVFSPFGDNPYMSTPDQAHNSVKGEFDSSFYPSPRELSVATSSTEDEFEHLAWIRGGFSYDSSYVKYFFNDLWQYNVITNQFSWMHGTYSVNSYTVYDVTSLTPGVYSDDNTPNNAIMANLWTKNGNLYLYGGASYMHSLAGTGDERFYNEFWIYNISELNWALIGGFSEVTVLPVYPDLDDTEIFMDFDQAWPSSRLMGITFVDPLNSDYLWLIGGMGGAYSADMWVYSIKRNQWAIFGGGYSSYGNVVAEYEDEGEIHMGGSYGHGHIINFEENEYGVLTPVLYVFGGVGLYKQNTLGVMDQLWRIENFAVHSCHGIDHYDSTVCSGIGTCNESTYSCDCPDGYFDLYPGCLAVECANGRFSNETEGEDPVCNYPNGLCSFEGKCVCNTGFFGADCSIWRCYSYLANQTTVCNGHGTCDSIDECNCYDGYTGTNCSLSLSGISAASLWWVFVLVISVVLAVGVIALIIVIFVCYKLIKAQKKVKKFTDVIDEDELDIMKKEKDLEMQSVGEKARISINKKLFEISFEEIKLLKQIGSGGSNSGIYKADWRGRDVAIKIFQVIGGEDFDEFEKELKIMGSISHPSILSFFGCSLKIPRIGIIMEFCKNGDLSNYMQMNPNSLKFKEKVRVLADVASAVEYLHSRSIIHRDLKSKNILLDNLLNPKLIDFGLSKIIESESMKKGMTRYTGTSFYMAPEVTMGKNYNHKCDVFSFAIIMWEVYYCNFLPYGSKSEYGVERQVANDSSFRPNIEILKEDEGWFLEYTQSCWDHSPEKRPDFSEIHTLLRDYSKGNKTLKTGNKGNSALMGNKKYFPKMNNSRINGVKTYNTRNNPTNFGNDNNKSNMVKSYSARKNIKKDFGKRKGNDIKLRPPTRNLSLENSKLKLNKPPIRNQSFNETILTPPSRNQSIVHSANTMQSQSYNPGRVNKNNFESRPPPPSAMSYNNKYRGNLNSSSNRGNLNRGRGWGVNGVKRGVTRGGRGIQRGRGTMRGRETQRGRGRGIERRNDFRSYNPRKNLPPPLSSGPKSYGYNNDY